jgi:cell division protein ZapA
VSQPNTVTVNILGKDYQVACPEEQQAELVVSAKYLDKQMRSIRDTGKVIGLERISVMAALNISYELLQAADQGGQVTLDLPDNNDLSAYNGLNQKIDDALYKLKQLEIN